MKIDPEVLTAIAAVGLIQDPYNPNFWWDGRSTAKFHTSFVLWASEFLSR